MIKKAGNELSEGTAGRRDKSTWVVRLLGRKYMTGVRDVVVMRFLAVSGRSPEAMKLCMVLEMVV